MKLFALFQIHSNNKITLTWCLLCANTYVLSHWILTTISLGSITILPIIQMKKLATVKGFDWCHTVSLWIVMQVVCLYYTYSCFEVIGTCYVFDTKYCFPWHLPQCLRHILLGKSVSWFPYKMHSQPTPYLLLICPIQKADVERGKTNKQKTKQKNSVFLFYEKYVIASQWGEDN